MSDLVVIFDPIQQVGAIINTRERRAFGPAEVGEFAAEALGAFVEQVGQYIESTVPTIAAATYESWKEKMAESIEAADEQTATGPVGLASAAQSSDGEVRLAEATAAASGAEAPAAGPADTDPDAAAAGQPLPVDADLVETEAVSAPAGVPSEQTCPNCNGDGVITYGTEQAPTQCGMCSGTGKVTVTA